MLTTTLRAMWKDWGFAPSLFAQAKEFLDLAKLSGTPEGYIRASIVFSLMSFEAYWGDVIRGYIQQKGNGIYDPAKLPKIQKELNNRFSIKTALETWPQLLVGEPSTRVQSCTRTSITSGNTATALYTGKSRNPSARHGESSHKMLRR